MDQWSLFSAGITADLLALLDRTVLASRPFMQEAILQTKSALHTADLSVIFDIIEPQAFQQLLQASVSQSRRSNAGGFYDRNRGRIALRADSVRDPRSSSATATVRIPTVEMALHELIHALSHPWGASNSVPSSTFAKALGWRINEGVTQYFCMSVMSHADMTGAHFSVAKQIAQYHPQFETAVALGGTVGYGPLAEYYFCGRSQQFDGVLANKLGVARTARLKTLLATRTASGALMSDDEAEKALDEAISLLLQ